MSRGYDQLAWVDYPETLTPISAANLNRMENGIANLYSDRNKLESNMAYVEDGDTSSRHYDIDAYLMHNGVFYKVTEEINIGDTLDYGLDGNIAHVDISSQFGSGGGGSTGCVELTQAQYDALSEEAKMADVIYLITDSPDNYVDEVFGDFATVEPISTASKAYEAGDYLVYDNKFYLVTDDIAQGDTITPGTNVEQTTVGEEFTKRCLPDGVKMVETARVIPTTVALSPNDGKVLTALTGQSLTATIPEGYILAGHANIVINGQAGMYPIFDGTQMKLSTIDPFIFNVGSGTLPAGSNLTIRLYSLVVKTTGVLTGGTHEAASIVYDNTTSGLTATNAQDALDELTANSTFLSTKQLLFNSISLAANATTSINVADITRTGYKPLMYSFQPGDWCDHLGFGIPTARIEGNAVKIGTLYLMNVSNAEAQAAAMYINILWQKI